MVVHRNRDDACSRATAPATFGSHKTALDGTGPGAVTIDNDGTLAHV